MHRRDVLRVGQYKPVDENNKYKANRCLTNTVQPAIENLCRLFIPISSYLAKSVQYYAVGGTKLLTEYYVCFNCATDIN